MPSTLFTEQFLLVGGMHHEERPVVFASCPVQLSNFVNDFQPVQMWHVEVKDQQSDWAIVILLRLLEVLPSEVYNLLAISHVCDYVGVKEEGSCEKCLHCKHHEVHVVGNDDLSSKVRHGPVVTDFLRSSIVVSREFSSLSQHSFLAIYKAQLSNLVVVRKSTSNLKAKQAAAA